MNKVIMMGRLTRDPEVRYGGQTNTAIARFTIAVDRRFKREGQPTADFFDCNALGKLGEFVERYLKKGTKILLEGELQNNNYQNKDGQMVYSMRILANNIEFAESKKFSEGNSGADYSQMPSPAKDSDLGDGFMNMPEGSMVDSLPFGEDDSPF